MARSEPNTALYSMMTMLGEMHSIAFNTPLPSVSTGSSHTGLSRGHLAIRASTFSPVTKLDTALKSYRQYQRCESNRRMFLDELPTTNPAHCGEPSGSACWILSNPPPRIRRTISEALGDELSTIE